ncbi:MAG: SUMF1/EgtB/PvdO family nonheme iron enzyme [Methanobacteriota archaeon]
MPDIEIKRGYEVLPDNNVRFGIRVINNSDSAISDVEVILDFTESLFHVEGSKIQKLGNIPPSVPRTAKFILKPLGCIHKENISATIIFKDHQWKKHTLEMRPREVHCVCPFLKEKSIKRADFLDMSQSGFMEERGLNFGGISVDKLVDFLAHTCKNRLYKVDEFTIENGKILYLAGDAVGEKAYYLLTAVVKEYEGLGQVMLRASSDKKYGLHGFLNEILDNLRHLVASTSAREIGVIKKEHVINIIDSVVQRSTISIEDGASEIKIKDSMVQRVEIKGDEERKGGEEERQGKIEAKRREKELQREHEEEKSQRRQSEKTTQMQREQEDEVAKKEPEAKSSYGKFLAVVLVLGILALGYWMLGYWMLAPGSTKEPLKSTPSLIPQDTTTNIQNPVINPIKVAPTASIIAADNPDTKGADLKIQHKGGDILKGGDWKLSIVYVGSPPKYITSSSDFSVGNQIVAATTTEDAASLTNSTVIGENSLLSGTKYNIKLVHIPSNELLLDQIIEMIGESTPTFTNFIGMEFVLIPAGEFDMGSPAGEKDRGSDEDPIHRVKISNAFYMGKYEVIQKQWREVMGSNPSYFKGDNLPVEQVSWNDAQEFIKKLNEKEGVNKYRLPSEAEWEYAARAGATTRYSFGDDESKLGGYAWYFSNSGSKTHEFGQKNPNPWGLYDMHGNVWEWVQDMYHDSYSGAPADGSAWESVWEGHGGSRRVYRGGSWSGSVRYCRSAARDHRDPIARNYGVGIRLLRIL